jgi:hypothetical protein
LEPGASGRVEDEDLADLGPGGVGVVDDVGLDRGRERRAVPLEDRGHDQPGALPGLRGADAEDRDPALGGDQLAVVLAQGDPPARRPGGVQLGKLAARRPARCAVAVAAVHVP